MAVERGILQNLASEVLEWSGDKRAEWRGTANFIAQQLDTEDEFENFAHETMLAKAMLCALDDQSLSWLIAGFDIY